ncbi:MAG: hypothetical protein ABSG89_09190 [Bacteroidales bacterium]|jgi:hypothetical protein
MASGILKKIFISAALIAGSAGVYAQGTVPLGIYYQAVARDNEGNELASTQISVKFSILQGDPLGTVVYQELHDNVITSKFGVFSLVIGKGVPTGNSQYSSLGDIPWKDADHYLKVEVKFANDFMDMGTMQFLAVPYALYAQQSLEPGPQGPQGPQGPKGDPGDPASDNQTLSFDGSNLSISNGNTVNLSSLTNTQLLSILGDTLSIQGGNKVGLPNQIQDLQLDNNNQLKITKNPSATLIDLSSYKQSLSYDTTHQILSISNGNSADLSSIERNSIQDIHLTGNLLTIDKNPSSTGVDLSKYLDNTDNQQLTYNDTTKTLSIDRGNSVTLGTMVAFRARNATSDAASINSYPIMTYDAVDYNIGNYLNPSTGIFTTPTDGIYTFNVSYYADGTGDGREIDIYVNSVLYEKLALSIAGGSTIPVRSVTMKLSAANTVSVVVYTGLATQTGTGIFSGFKVY